MSLIFTEYLMLRRKQLKNWIRCKEGYVPSHTIRRMFEIASPNGTGSEINISCSEMVCRVCMNPADIPLSEEIEDFQIISAIRNVANIAINHADCFPKYICQDCLKELKIALKFKQRCESSDYKLRLYLKQNNSHTTTSMVYHDFQLILHQLEQKRLKKMKIPKEENTENIDTNTMESVTQTYRNKRGSKCIPCNLVFPSKVELLNHQQEQNCILKPCLRCGKLVLNLRAHMRRAHENFQVFSCHVCGKTTKSARLLNSHLLVHSDRFKYSCPLCPYKGKQRAYLSLHMRTHTGERPYLCSQCPATFVNASNLKKHQLIHSSKEFECQECKKLFRFKKTLTDHYNAVHLKLRYQCNICGRELWNRGKLLRHEIRMHKREKHKLNTKISKVVASDI